MDYKNKVLHYDDLEIQLALCTACTNAFLYKTAYDKYEIILNSPIFKIQISKDVYAKIKINQHFCKSPMPWSSEPKNITRFRYLHNFLLKRLGNRRYSFIREEDILEFNSFLRRTNYYK